MKASVLATFSLAVAATALAFKVMTVSIPEAESIPSCLKNRNLVAGSSGSILHPLEFVIATLHAAVLLSGGRREGEAASTMPRSSVAASRSRSMLKTVWMVTWRYFILVSSALDG
jgi:hypothetical protein